MAEAKLTRGQWRAFWALSGTILFQQAFDLISTLYLLQIPGFYEGNPLMAPILESEHGWLWGTLFKAGATVLLSAVIYKVLKEGSQWIWAFMIPIVGYFMLMGWQSCLVWLSWTIST